MSKINEILYAPKIYLNKVYLTHEEMQRKDNFALK